VIGTITSSKVLTGLNDLRVVFLLGILFYFFNSVED
jgi:endonuclease V-like protein UPF0215 family